MGRRWLLAWGLFTMWSATVVTMRAESLPGRWAATTMALAGAWSLAVALLPGRGDR